MQKADEVEVVCAADKDNSSVGVSGRRLRIKQLCHGATAALLEHG